MSSITVLRNGEWIRASIVGYGLQGKLFRASLGQSSVKITVTGSTFEPRIELKSGSSALVYWVDSATGKHLAVGTAPRIQWQENGIHNIAMRVEIAGADAFNEVEVLNFGFNHTDDAGRYNIGQSYNYPSQSIIGITNITLLKNLRYFMAASTPLTGHLDFSGLSKLEFIECFYASIETIDLSGCESLIRLCLERNRISLLNLNPVAPSLRDLRAAIQNEGRPGQHSLTFVSLTQPMSLLYHYCVRDQQVIQSIPLNMLPMVEEHWAWNTGQTTSTAVISPVLRSFANQGNSYDQASVDRILQSIAGLITYGDWKVIDLLDSASPSNTGQEAIQTLRSNGWEVRVG